MSEGFATSRRQFFAAGAVAVAALPGASASIATAIAGKPFAMQDLDDWKAHVGKQFVLDGAASMKLVSVTATARQPASLPRRNNFSAVFELDGQSKADGTYTVAHTELGQAQLYLQPGKGKPGKPTLYASFS